MLRYIGNIDKMWVILKKAYFYTDMLNYILQYIYSIVIFTGMNFSL